MEFKELIPQKIKENLPGVNSETSEYRNELTIHLDKKDIVEVCSFLKKEPDLQFILCEDITAIDWARRKNRFTMVYHLFSLKNKFRLRLKIPVDSVDNPEDLSVDSVSSVWKTANWHEREVFDMYGIKFNNHPDLRRMYMPEEFEYYPLRKDFPLMGIPGSLPLPKKDD